MTILITGGAGFIGANLCKLLMERKRSFLVLDNFSARCKRDYLNGLVLDGLYGDVRDPELLEHMVRRAYAVVHLAALPGIEDSINRPWPSFETNVIGTWRVLNAAAKWGKRVVFASSVAVFGNGEPPYDEGSPTAPVSPYGAAKLAGENFCQAFAATYDLPVTILRFGNAYGSYSAHKSSVVTQFAVAALKGAPLAIHGGGEQTRDFIYAPDLCEAIMAAIDDDCAIGETFQVATGAETSINELAAIVAGVVKSDLPLAYAARRVGDVKRNFADVSKIRCVLGWEPRTGLGRGVEKTIEWFRDNVSV